MKRQLMAEQWNEFARLIAKDAPTVQRQEMRRAFYAGAQSILFRLIAALAPEDYPTDADVQILEDIHQELQDFAKALKEGRA